MATGKQAGEEHGGGAGGMTDAELPGCLSDLCSVEGLRRRAREQPRRWHLALREHARSPSGDPEGATVERFLRGGWIEELLPRHHGDMERLRRDRGCAARLVGLVGETLVGDVDEAAITRARENLIDGDAAAGRAAVSGEVATRTASLLRRIAVRWAEEVHHEPRVAARAPGAGRAAQRRPPRRTCALPELRRLLHAAWPWERAVLALALGGGLRESEIASLRRRELLVEAPAPRPRRVPRVPAPPRRIEIALDVTAAAAPYGPRRVRIIALPVWAGELILSGRAGIATVAPADLLFPHRSDPTRPRSGFRNLLAQIRARDERPWMDPPCTLATLRACWQRVAREAGATREVVRQTWSMEVPAPGVRGQSQALQAVRRLAAAWATFDAPVARVLVQGGTLPRRAPKGCAADEPEKADPWRGWERLPPSCR